MPPDVVQHCILRIFKDRDYRPDQEKDFKFLLKAIEANPQKPVVIYFLRRALRNPSEEQYK